MWEFVHSEVGSRCNDRLVSTATQGHNAKFRLNGIEVKLLVTLCPGKEATNEPEQREGKMSIIDGKPVQQVDRSAKKPAIGRPRTTEAHDGKGKRQPGLRAPSLDRSDYDIIVINRSRNQEARDETSALSSTTKKKITEEAVNSRNYERGHCELTVKKHATNKINYRTEATGNSYAT